MKHRGDFKMFQEKFWIIMMSFITKKKKLEPSAILDPPFWINQMHPILLNKPIYMRIGYILDLSFLEWKIQPTSTIFGILNK